MCKFSGYVLALSCSEGYRTHVFTYFVFFSTLLCFSNTNLEGNFVQELELFMHMKEILRRKEICKLFMPHKDHCVRLAHLPPPQYTIT